MAPPEEQEGALAAARRAWQAFRGAEPPTEQQLPAAPKPDAGWPAVQRLWRHLLGGRQMHGEQPPEIPGEIAEGWKAVLGALAFGALFGAGEQWQQEQKRAVTAVLMPRRLSLRELTPKVAVLLRLSDSALRYGLAWGGAVALGLGVHGLCVVYRGSRMWGVDGAAAAAAMTTVGTVHYLSHTTRTWPLPPLVASQLKGYALFNFISCLVLDEAFGVMDWEERRKAEAAAKEAAEEADKQRRAEALAAQRQRDVAAELLAQLEAAQRGQARSGAAAAAQIDELQRRQQPG